jgi:hypothetical protein
LPQIHEWTHCADWLEIVSRRKGAEFEIQKRLHQELGGKMEAYTPVGPIDLITKTEAIEIKRNELPRRKRTGYQNQKRLNCSSLCSCR